MAKKTGRPARLVNPHIHSLNIEKAKLEFLRRLSHERSIRTSTHISVCDLIREAIDAHFGCSMTASEPKPDDSVVTM